MNEDRASRYHRLQRQAVIASAAFGAAGVMALIAEGGSRALAAWALGVAAPLPSPLPSLAAAVLVTVIVAAGYELLALPFVFYRTWLLDRRYGLSAESLATWTRDHLKAVALAGILTIAAALIIWTMMSVTPEWWWLAAGLAFGAAGALVARAAPTVLLPLFYRFTPLGRAALVERLLTLSRRAGVQVVGAFEWSLGEKTTRANAALVGMGKTRRILVSDTLLKDYSEDEIEVILAHELAHHVHSDLWSALAVETVLLTVSFRLADAVAAALAPPLGLTTPHDLAALPLIALAAAAGAVLLSPIGKAWSRHHERRADRFALELTARPAAFVSAMRRLGAQNLAEERPSRLAIWLFHTHPPIEDRIGAARAFESA